MSSIVMPFITPLNARQLNSDFSIPAGSRIVMIGTSLTDNGYRDHTETFNVTGYAARGGFSWARTLTNQNLDWYNVGIGGNTIDDMQNRYDMDVVPLEPDYVLFDAGTNDASMTVQDYITALSALYAKANEHGAIAIPMEIPMRELSRWRDSIRDKILHVNAWIRENYPNAIDTNKYFMDSVTLRPYPNYTVDGTHWNNEGAYHINRAIIDGLNISGSRNIIGTPINSNSNLTGNNGVLDGGVTGTVPDGYRADILNGAPTVIANANNPSLTLNITPSGVAGDEQIFIYAPSVDPVIAVDKLYEMIARLNASNWDGWKSIEIRLNQIGSDNIYSYDLKNDSSDNFWPNDALVTDTLLRTDPIYASSDTTRYQMSVEITINGDASRTGQLNL